MSQFLQFLFSGLTVGAVYAIVAIGFTLIYAASHVVNLAQGEFVMLGGMLTSFFLGLGLPLVGAILLAVAITTVIGVLLQKLAIEQAHDASAVTLIMITVGASNVLRGVASLIFDKEFHSLPAFSGSVPFHVLGATILPQSLWVLGGSIAMFVALSVFLDKTVIGKAMRASAANPFAAKLVGIDIGFVLMLAFGLAAALGALAGILVTPITLTRYDVGALLGVKGFSAAIFGGLGNPIGAMIGGLVLGVLEAFAAGYVTSAYKDAVSFVALIVVLLFMPTGLLGSKVVDRV